MTHLLNAAGDRGRTLRCLWFCLGVAVSGLLAGRVATAQPTAAEPSEVSPVFQPAPSDVRKPLMRATRAVEERRFADAAYELGRLLMSEDVEQAEAQDYFLFDDASQPPGRTSLKGEVQRMLAELPSQGREAYELQFGAQARALLDQALAAGDMDLLADVIRRFLHTQAGYEASVLAGRYELSCGRPAAAALHLQRVANTPQAASRFEPELSVLLATCWLYAEMPDKARQTLVAMRGRTAGDSLALGGQAVKLFDDQTQAVNWLESLIGQRHPLVAPELTQWVLYRGNPQRNGRAPGSLPLLNHRWRVPTCIDRADEKVVETLVKQYRDKGEAALPAMQPLAAGDTILMRTPRKLLGVDFASGKRIWVWPPWESDTTESWYGGINREQIAAANREDEVSQRIWEDAAHGQLSSDGESVFLIHELGFAAAGNFSPNRVFIAQGGIPMPFPGAPRSNNQLVSLSLARQGAAQWIVGGEGGEDEPKLAGAFFLGPPLPLRGKLYALAEFNGEIRLVVLNGSNGQLLWQQQLAHVDAQTIENDSSRRLAGAMPSYEGGVLLCPTSAGALVAVDIASRSLLWGYQYQKSPSPSQNRAFGIVQLRQRELVSGGSRWADSIVTVADGRVLLTPTETDDLHCLDLLTGQPVWDPQPRGERLYLACVHQGRAVFVGQNQVTALRLADGQPAWDQPLELADLPSGRGFYTGEYYFLPTHGPELLKIDLDSAQVVGRTSTSVVLGNLVCYRDELISHGPEWLAIFYQSDPLQARVEADLTRDPQDLNALARYGELLLAQGKRDEAIQVLRKVCQTKPDNENVRSLLVEMLMNALEDDFAAHLDTVNEIQRLTDHPVQRSRLLRLLARGWQKQEETGRAFAAYLELATLKDTLLDRGGSAAADPEELERHWNCRTERWLQARFGELLEQASAAQREEMEQAIRPWLEKALTSGETADLRRFLRYFATHPRAGEVRLRLAANLVDTGELAEAQLLLASLEHHPEGDLQAQATALLAALLEQGRQYDESLACYRQLAERWADAVCRDGKTGRQLLDEALGRQGLQQAASRSRPWAAGQVQVVESAEQGSRYPSYRRVYGCQLQQRTGAAPSGVRVFFDQHPNSLLIRDGDGNTVLSVNLGSRRLNTTDSSLIQVRIHGHLMLVSMGMELLAIDLIQASRNPSAPILWRKELTLPAGTTGPYQTHVKVQTLAHPWGDDRRVFAEADKQLLGVTATLSHWGAYYINLRELVCADPLTGQPLWSRQNIPPGSDLFGDDELLFVVPPGSDQAQVFNALDGSPLGVRQVDELEHRWATSGRRVLAWSQEEATQPLTLRLYDAWSGAELWREAVPADSKATLIEDDEVAILQSDGRFLVRSLEDAAVRLATQVEPEEGLLSLYVIRSQEQYLLVTNRTAPAEPNTPAANIRSVLSGSATPLVSGHAYAFQRQSGERAWPQPAVIDRYGFPVDQPSEMPVLLFLRHYRPDAEQAATRQHTSVLALHRSDGRPVMEQGDIPAQTYTYDVAADRNNRTVTVGLPGKSITMMLTDQPLEAIP